MPTNCQTEISDSVVSAYSSLPSQGAYSHFSPTAPSSVDETPQIGLRISFQVKPMMTTESMVGMKIAVR